MRAIIFFSAALVLITIATSQENFTKRPKSSLKNTQSRNVRLTTPSISGGNKENSQIRNKKLQIASLVDMENVKFGLQLKATSERRMKAHKKWTQAELLSQINRKVQEILKLKQVKGALGELLKLGASADEAKAAVEQHMDFKHMEITVKHALDPNYPGGTLPYWKTTVASRAAAEAKKLIKTTVDELQANKQ